jgi:hypothetical protein
LTFAGGRPGSGRQRGISSERGASVNARLCRRSSVDAPADGTVKADERCLSAVPG